MQRSQEDTPHRPPGEGPSTARQVLYHRAEPTVGHDQGLQVAGGLSEQCTVNLEATYPNLVPSQSVRPKTTRGLPHHAYTSQVYQTPLPATLQPTAMARAIPPTTGYAPTASVLTPPATVPTSSVAIHIPMSSRYDSLDTVQAPTAAMQRPPATAHGYTAISHAPTTIPPPQDARHIQSPQVQTPPDAIYAPQAQMSTAYTPQTNRQGPLVSIPTPSFLQVPTQTLMNSMHALQATMYTPQANMYESPIPQFPAPLQAGPTSMHPYQTVSPPLAPTVGPAVYGPVQPTPVGFTQTHQVKNVQVFSGNPDCKILIEDWIRDMQYLLDAGGLPTHLCFATVVRHLSGEARRLVLNLPPQEQHPEGAFDELRAEYGDIQRSLDPLADFYERSQRPGESACSYAIALEATLRSVEEAQHGGRPFPDRDGKLTRQFLRGLNEEEVYLRIAPMKPMLLSFRELQAELRNLARETKKFHPQHKPKKPISQAHVAVREPQGGAKDKADVVKPTSELAELTEMVKKLALSQEEQVQRLTQLESKMVPLPNPAPIRTQQAWRSGSAGATFLCYRCGRAGHTARVCRAVLPDNNQITQPQPPPTSSQEGSSTQAGQSLNA